MTTTCTANETFAGIPLGNCGQPAADTITSVCPEGHEERTPICADHKTLFLASDAPLMCPQCADGELVYMEVTR